MSSKWRDGYYPFGLTFNHSNVSPENYYKHAGNEEQQEWGVYDFNARMYDPALGRFGSVDPLADAQSSWNPYHYNYDNPARFTDVRGLAPTDGYSELSSQQAYDYHAHSQAAGDSPDFSKKTKKSKRLRKRKKESNKKFRRRVGKAVLNFFKNGYRVKDFSVWFSFEDDNAKWGGRYWGVNNGEYFGVNLLQLRAAAKDQDNFEILNFVQSVKTNVNKKGEVGDFQDIDFKYEKTIPFIYMNSGNLNRPPLYYKSGLKHILLNDQPRRAPIHNLKGISWQAQTSLVGRHNGHWKIISTVTWGFNYINGKFNSIPVGLTNPNTFQIDAVESANE